MRLRPEKMNKKLFATLNALGRQLAAQGSFTQQSVKAFSSRERYTPILIPLIKLAVKMPFMKLYWNVQLKKNNAFKDRFARPYEEIIV